MEKKTIAILLMGLVLGVIIVNTAYQTIETNTLKQEHEDLTRDYGYAKDMLGGFLHDYEGMKEQIKAIRSNPQDII